MGSIVWTRLTTQPALLWLAQVTIENMYFVKDLDAVEDYKMPEPYPGPRFDSLDSTVQQARLLPASQRSSASLS